MSTLDYDQLNVTTMTVIVESNIMISLDDFYSHMKIVDRNDKQQNGNITYARYKKKGNPKNIYFSSSILFFIVSM